MTPLVSANVPLAPPSGLAWTGIPASITVNYSGAAPDRCDARTCLAPASHITGPLGNAADNATVFKGISSTLLYAALAVVIVILLITYRSPVLWLLPVISSGRR